MSSSRVWNLSGVLLAGLLGACSDEEATPEAGSTWAISSPAFAEGAKIPAEYTCEGRPFPVALSSPELNWTDGPAGTKSYAIVVKHLAISEVLPPTDPNYFKGFMWTIWDIPATVKQLPANIARDAFPPQIPGAQQWSIRNQFGWFAPCPNADPAPVAADPTTRVTDRYGIEIYALGTDKVTLPPKPADVTNYTMTLATHLETVSVGSTMLEAVSDAVSSAAPTPVDAATLQFPAGTVP
jgi:phosphatidylethanolamine-binding protein (PEBP) family uncharacterized protein